MDKETDNNVDERLQDLTPSSLEVKAKQRRLFWILLGAGLGLLLLLIIHWLTFEAAPIEAVSQTAPIYDVGRTLEDKSYWMYKSEQVLKEQAKNVDVLQKKLETLETQWVEAEKTRKNEITEAHHQQLERLTERLEQLESHPASSVQKTEEERVSEWTRPLPPRFLNPGPLKGEGNPATLMPGSFPSRAIFSEKFTLSPQPQALQSKLPHVSHYIPVGTFARAVLLNGIDVSVGLSSQQNPQPVLLRMTDKGSLPNHAVGDMKDCRLIGAAHGDYSSERAFIRVEKLSCVQKDNSIIETDVGGFVVGLDGKAGLRGPMITRDGELLAQGFISGLFSGLGKAASMATGTASVTPFGTTTMTPGKEIFKKAGGEGMGSAFEILSRYAIKRLEQLQPIIQISANREVDIVFHTGSSFGEKKERVREKTVKAQNTPLEALEGFEARE